MLLSGDDKRFEPRPTLCGVFCIRVCRAFVVKFPLLPGARAGCIFEMEVFMDIFWLVPVGLAVVAFLIGFYLMTMRHPSERTDGTILTDKPSAKH